MTNQFEKAVVAGCPDPNETLEKAIQQCIEICDRDHDQGSQDHKDCVASCEDTNNWG